MEIGQDIQRAASLLAQGEVVAIPTETVYGLAANAFDKKAVARIFEIKNRPTFNPLIVHIKNIEYLHSIADTIDGRLIKLMKIFASGPLTILVDKKSVIPDMVTAGSKRVAVRIPNHPLTLQLLNILDFPLAAPSANPFQYISPTSAQQVADQIGHKIPYILDGGKCTIGIESTIIGIEDGKLVVYRLGGVPVEELQKYSNDLEIKTQSSTLNAVDTPGQLKKHYSPQKPLFIGNVYELINQFLDKKIAVITFGKKTLPPLNTIIEYNLSERADSKEAAANLFETLYSIDRSDADIIIAELLPDEGLGKAINDRLIRASNLSTQL